MISENEKLRNLRRFYVMANKIDSRKNWSITNRGCRFVGTIFPGAFLPEYHGKTLNRVLNKALYIID